MTMEPNSKCSLLDNWFADHQIPWKYIVKIKMYFKKFLNKSPVCITTSWYTFYKQKYLCLSKLQFMPTERKCI